MPYTKSQVADRVVVLFAPTPVDPRPPELATVLCCIAALQEDLEFTLLDDEGDESVPEWLYSLPSTEYCKWDGSAEGSFGYGSVAIVNTNFGAGLRVLAGGYPAQGPTGFWVLPTKALWTSGL